MRKPNFSIYEKSLCILICSYYSNSVCIILFFRFKSTSLSRIGWVESDLVGDPEGRLVGDEPEMTPRGYNDSIIINSTICVIDKRSSRHFRQW